MLSGLFTTKACYAIKENNKNKSFCRGKLPFCERKLTFWWRKLRKAYFAAAFSLPVKITILPTQIEKSQGKKIWIARVAILYTMLV